MNTSKLRVDAAWLVIPLALIFSYLIYQYVLGNPSNFVDGNPQGDPLPGNFLGTIYKGGFLVVLLISFQFIGISYIVERFIALKMAYGKTKLTDFAQKIRKLMNDNDIEGIIKHCDYQKGSAASVVKTGIVTFLELKKQDQIDQKDIYIIQKELEEATQLEIPLLNKNMFILATLAQIATLVGLLGTVTGMIKAFAALASIGEPDAVGLASGISQALVTTALGIATAAVTIVFYNYFSNKIEQITYAIDESSFSIIHTLKTKYFDQHAA